MCEEITKRGTKCTKPARYQVHIEVKPQPLGKNGEYGMERSPAGRMKVVCRAHVLPVVDELNALSIRTYAAAATVRPVI